MSSKAEEEADKDVCANCGIAGVDEIKLKECQGCDLVKYCSEKCREEHRQQHHEDCKKRADELHDKRLFTQPEGTHLGECPICFLQIAHGIGKSTFMSCCSQWICRGCHLAHKVSNINDKLKASTCLFCRASVLDKKEFEKRKKERIEANDPAALCYRGTKFYQSDDYDKAIEYWTKASELGIFRLGWMYLKEEQEEGVEKDEDKGIYHWEKAAIGGHPDARCYLGSIEGKNGNMERAVKHSVIAANLGCVTSMKVLLEAYKAGYITKEEYGTTLRTHQAAINATKSPEREAAEKIGF
jgi:tetratricopeptide (TPR) repeat protein